MVQTGLPRRGAYGHGLPVCYQMNFMRSLTSSVIYYWTVFSTSSIVSGNFRPLVSGSAKTSKAPSIQAVPTITPGKGFQNTSKTSIKKPSTEPKPPQAAPVGRIVNRFQFQNTYLQFVSTTWRKENNEEYLLTIPIDTAVLRIGVWNTSVINIRHVLMATPATSRPAIEQIICTIGYNW